MKEEDIRLIKQEIKSNREAGKCGLASNNEKFEWTKTADALERLLDYITNLQTIEQQYSAILSENAELQQKYDMALEDNVKESKRRMELQEENKILKELQQELERYKNIIDELEKWLTLQRDNLDKRVSEMETDDKNMTRANHYTFIYNRVIDKLKELKGE